jgi:hypothetical protein
VLLDYGATFADFIERFEPAGPLPYLADVARIERAWREAYHARDAVPLTAADLAGVAEAEVPSLVMTLHPSLRLLASRHPARTIWTMNAGEGEIGEVDLSRSEDTLIVRPTSEVTVRSVPPGGVAFVGALMAGESLGAAAAAGLAAEPHFDIAGNLAGLIGAGAVVGFTVAKGGALQ